MRSGSSWGSSGNERPRVLHTQGRQGEAQLASEASSQGQAPASAKPRGELENGRLW